MSANFFNMAIIYNSDLMNEVTNGAKIQVSRDKVPNELAEKVIPVMEVNPRLLRISNYFASNVSSATGTLTVTTTPTDRDIYITYIQFAMIKNAACDQANGYLNLTAVVGGATVNLIRTAVLTLTAQEQNVIINLSNPIKLDRGTAVSIGAAFTAGNLNRAVTLIGYEVLNTKA